DWSSDVCSSDLLFNFVAGTELGITLGICWPYESFHGEQIDYTDEVVFSADWQLHNQWLGTQTGLDGVYGVVKVRTEFVHLVDETDRKSVVFICLTPDGFRLWFNAFFSVE